MMGAGGMMIVDSQIRPWFAEFTPQKHIEWTAWRIAQRRIPPGDPKRLEPRMLQGLDDPDGSKAVAWMDEFGVGAALHIVLDLAGVYDQEAPKSIEEINHAYSEIAKKQPGRLYPLCGVDPRRPIAVDLLRRAVREWGMAGLSLFPSAGFSPSDRVVWPLYEACLDLGVPALIQCSPHPAPMRNHWGRPINFDEIGVQFRDLPVIMGRTGMFAGRSGWVDEAIGVAATRANYYLDLSEWQSFGGLEDEEWLTRTIARMRDAVGATRIVWGTDGPVTWRPERDARWISFFKELPEAAPKYGCRFTPEEIDLILGGNLQRIFNIPDRA
jgi:predicted TIM-barrel fold metal-dependent hydrolase